MMFTLKITSFYLLEVCTKYLQITDDWDLILNGSRGKKTEQMGKTRLTENIIVEAEF